MKRILHVVSRMGYGGVETLLMNIYRNINREEVQFDFVVNSKEKGEYDDEIKMLGGNIYYLPSRRENWKKYAKNWKVFLEEHASKFCTIHMHVSSLTDIVPIKLAKIFGIKNRFIHAHNTYQKGIIHNILNKYNKLFIEKYATRLLACSSEAGKYCYGNKKFEVIKNGIDAKKYSYDLEHYNTTREQLKINPRQVAFVHVGRFSEQKNHTFLIDIFNEILKIDNNIKLFLIGEGELMKQTMEKVKTLRIEENVKFLGKRNDVNEILKAMDAFLLPSLHEGLPVVGIEAQAAGLPIFTSDTVSKELAITRLVKFYSLNDTAKEWAEKIIDSMRYYKRYNTYEEIASAGYDICNTTQKLKEYYEN